MRLKGTVWPWTARGPYISDRIPSANMIPRPARSLPRCRVRQRGRRELEEATLRRPQPAFWAVAAAVLSPGFSRRPAGRGQPDPAVQAAREKEITAFRAKYPPT